MNFHLFSYICFILLIYVSVCAYKCGLLPCDIWSLTSFLRSYTLGVKEVHSDHAALLKD